MKNIAGDDVQRLIQYLLIKSNIASSSSLVSGVVSLCVMLVIGTIQASDHWDSPAARKDQAADITDIYAFPVARSTPLGKHETHLVLIMNVHPYASAPQTLEVATGKTSYPPPPDLASALQEGKAKLPGTQFSDAIAYNVRLRPATVNKTNDKVTVTTDANAEILIAATFDDDIFQSVTCSARVSPPNDIIVKQLVTKVLVDDERGGANPDLKVFAGCRADPFFADPRRIIFDMEPPEPPPPQLTLLKRPRDVDRKFNGKPFLPVGHANVLSLVVELNCAKIFSNAGTLVAVVAETNRAGVRIDRAGRPVTNNFLLSRHIPFPMLPSVASELPFLEDLWNREDGFNLDPNTSNLYVSAIQHGLSLFDSADEVSDWATPHQMLGILSHDFLLVDLNHPSTPSSSENGFLEIEVAHLRGNPHTTCGGRKPNEDAIDSFLTIFINGLSRAEPRRRDSVDEPLVKTVDAFPFLPPPHLR